MQAFERHFDTLQSAILEREYDVRTTADCTCGQEPASFRCKECFDAAPSCKFCLLSSHHHLPFHHVSVAMVRFGFFRFFIGFFIIENAVIDMTAQVMVENISPLHIFQIKKDSFKSMQPILRYSKNNKQLF